MTDRQYRKKPFLRASTRRMLRQTRHLKHSQWPSEKAALLGYLTGKGMTGPAIADEMGEGVSRQLVNKLQRFWKLPTMHGAGRQMETIPVPMSARQRSMIADAADYQGISVEDFIKRVTYYAAKDNMYEAIVDDRDDSNV
jgi:hypothetical protein